MAPKVCMRHYVNIKHSILPSITRDTAGISIQNNNTLNMTNTE